MRGTPSGQLFYDLHVGSVVDETALAKSFTLIPEPDQQQSFEYIPGQYLTLRIPHSDGEILRSYSFSSSPQHDPNMTICVKRVPGGKGSNWLNDNLKAGSRINATPPSGRFVLRASTEPVLLIAGGSGITPCISLVKHALHDTDRPVKLVYANRDQDSIIYRDQLEQLEVAFGERFECVHWIDETAGFMTPNDFEKLSIGWEKAHVYICGPAPLMDMAEQAMAEICQDDTKIWTERFLSPEDQDAKPKEQTPTDQGDLPDSFKIILNSEEHIVPLRSGVTLLEAAQESGVSLPSSCVEGHCGTCMAHLVSGEIEMQSTRALSKRNIARGFVLACQALPVSPEPITIDFDI